MSGAASGQVYTIRFDDRAFGVSIDPDNTNDPRKQTVDLLALAMASSQMVRIARETAERIGPECKRDAAYKLQGLLVGAEVLGSLMEALVSEIEATAWPVVEQGGKAAQ